MKPFVPPLAALALAAGWLGARQHSIATLERETVLLRDHLAAVRTGPVATPAPPRHPDHLHFLIEIHHGAGIGRQPRVR